MQAVLYKYLALHKKLDIPGIGHFKVEATPASLQFADKQLQPPGSRIVFSPTVSPINNHFYSFLSREWKVEKVIAIRRYKEEVEDMVENLKRLGLCELKGIGILRKTGDDSVAFAPAEPLLSLFPSLPAERVVRKYAQHTVLVGEREHVKDYVKPEETVSEEMIPEEEQPKERWKLYALVLAVIGLLMIVCYYVFG